MFRPLVGHPKVTIFGSARTGPDDPLYSQARDLAHELAQRGWMVITGAGPGIMAAGAEGAGPGRAIGISIRLPFEETANPDLTEGDHTVAMKYFFTRKLMLMKESSAFVSLPGGFGTQDETLELCTLLQTGKAIPAPLVLLRPLFPFDQTCENRQHGYSTTQSLIRRGDQVTCAGRRQR